MYSAGVAGYNNAESFNVMSAKMKLLQTQKAHRLQKNLLKALSGSLKLCAIDKLINTYELIICYSELISFSLALTLSTEPSRVFPPEPGIGRGVSLYCTSRYCMDPSRVSASIRGTYITQQKLTDTKFI